MRRSHRCNVLLAALFLAVVAMIALDWMLLRRAAPVASAPPPSRRTFAATRDDVHLWLYRCGLLERPPARLILLIDYQWSSSVRDSALTEIELGAPAK